MAGKSIALVVAVVLLIGAAVFYFDFYPALARQNDGTLNVNVADPMPAAWSDVYINVTSISAHNSTGGSFTNTFSTPETINLAMATTSYIFLTSLNIPAGHYQMIKMTIKGAYSVWNGVDRPQTFQFSVVNSTVDISGQFSVSKGSTTTVILDFNSAQAIHGTPTSGFTMTPVVSMTVG